MDEIVIKITADEVVRSDYVLRVYVADRLIAQRTYQTFEQALNVAGEIARSEHFAGLYPA